MRPLGKRQIDRLTLLCSYGRFLIVGDAITDTLISRGYAKAHGTNSRGFVAITPAGMRVVAAMIEDGRIEAPTPETVKRKRKEAAHV